MNIFLRRCCTVFFVGGLLLCAQVQAQEFHLGFVKTDRIFKESNAAKLSQTRLEQEFSKREKEIVAQEALLKSTTDKLQIEAPTLSDTQRISRQKELAEQDRELQRKRRSFQEDLNEYKPCNHRSEQISNEYLFTSLLHWLFHRWSVALRPGSSAGVSSRLCQNRPDLQRVQCRQAVANQVGAGVFQARKRNRYAGSPIKIHD